MDFSFTVDGSDVVFQHNTRKWELRTNRHPETSGESWGWIEGCEPHTCWSNKNRAKLSKAQAGGACIIHNEWIEQQRPLSFRILDARKSLQEATKQHDILTDKMFRSSALVLDLTSQLELLETEV